MLDIEFYDKMREKIPHHQNMFKIQSENCRNRQGEDP